MAGKIPAGTRNNTMVQNIDYAPTIVSAAGADTPENMNTFQGISLLPTAFTNKKPDQWRDAIYYCFYENPGEHNARATTASGRTATHFPTFGQATNGCFSTCRRTPCR